MNTTTTILIGAALLLLSSSSGTAAELDFGDHSSATLTTKAWDALNAKNHDNAVAYASKCIEMYEKEALAMQGALTEAVPSDDREAVSSKWALNDVGTCLFILGQSLEAQGKGKEALEAYRKLVDTLSFAQCWDPQGWFWKPADAAQVKVKALEFDALE